MDTYAVALLAFGLSFLFALGGVGAAIVLVPVLHSLGIPLNQAKPTGLFVNMISLIGASFSNIRNGRLDFSMGIPIIVSSIITAPLGAGISTLLPQKAVLGIFVLFLFFSGNMMLFFKKGKYADQYRSDRPMIPLVSIGSAAGLISGLLGVGGGGLVSPLMMMLGFNPKKVAAVTAFTVPFSSLAGFIAYWQMGHFNPAMALPVGLAACLGGYMGTHFMHSRLSPVRVKQFPSLVILGLGVKMLLKLF